MAKTNVYYGEEMLKELWRNFLTSGLSDEENSLVFLRVNFFNSVSLVGITSAVFFGLIHIHSGILRIGILEVTCGLIALINVFLLRWTGNVKLASTSQLSLMLIILCGLLISGGLHHTGIYWYYTYPALAFFLTGKHQGFFWLSGLYLLSIVIVILHHLHYIQYFPYSFVEIRQMLISLLAVSLLAFFYENVREANEIVIHKQNFELLKKNRDLLVEIAQHEQTEKILQEAKEIAESANRAKSDFLSNMSHELYTPLNHIIGFTDLVVSKQFGELNDTQEEYLSDALKSSRHLLSLINEMLDLSDTGTGKIALEPSEVNLRGLLEQTVTIFNAKALDKEILLSMEIHDDLPEVIIGDQAKLTQILYHLLSNAVKFTPHSGSIHIAARHMMSDELGVSRPLHHITPHNPSESRDYLEISVKDSGIGLKHGDLMRIFNPFERVSHSLDSTYQGPGLGLSLTKKFVKLHGGAIWTESDGEGRGSTFHVLIPVDMTRNFT